MSEIIWDKDKVHSAAEAQKEFFASGKTLDISWRIEQLKRLKEAVSSHEAQMVRALNEDLGSRQKVTYVTSDRS